MSDLRDLNARQVKQLFVWRLDSTKDDNVAATQLIYWGFLSCERYGKNSLSRKSSSLPTTDVPQ